MTIEMQFSESPLDLSHNKWDVSFVGKVIDTRGQKISEYISQNSSTIILFEYIPKDFRVKLDGNEFDKDDIMLQLKGMHLENVLIDATTLSFSEILILTQSLKDLDCKGVSMMYVEPQKYKRKSKSKDILHKRDFELSESIVGYEAIPGHALLVTNEIPQKVVFLCGFEAERIDRALEDSQIVNSYCSCVFGVPAYVPGWEMDSFDNNIYVMKERRITGGVNFCGATNPMSVYQTLDLIYNGLEEEEQMFVVPLATKPMNIGACLFLINKPKTKVAVLYDHPSEIAGKTLEISTWHLFNVIFN